MSKENFTTIYEMLERISRYNKRIEEYIDMKNHLMQDLKTFCREQNLRFPYQIFGSVKMDNDAKAFGNNDANSLEQICSEIVSNRDNIISK